MVLVWLIGVVDDDHRHARQRHRAAGARRRPDPDHPADRLHRHAARLCRRRAASGPVQRHGAAGAGRRPDRATRSGTGTWCATASSPGRMSACSSACAATASTGPARNWLPVLHTDDRDTFRTTLDVVLEHRRGRVSQNFRLRGADGHYHWFSLRARPVIGSDGEVMRCVGTLVDVTDQKKAEERLLHDAVHDNLTGLPNRELFMNRLEGMISIAKAEEKFKPTVFVVDIDRFKQVNDGLGISAGDTILLDHRAAAAPPAQAARRAVALCRRPVRADAVVRAGSGAHRRGRRCGQAGDQGADHLRQARDRADRLDRPDHLDLGAGDGRGHGQGCRARHAPGQALRRRPHRAVPAGLPLGRHRSAAARIRSAPRHRAARNSRSPTSRSCGSRTAPSPASRRCCAGSTRAAARSRRRTSSRSPKAAG